MAPSAQNDTNPSTSLYLYIIFFLCFLNLLHSSTALASMSITMSTAISSSEAHTAEPTSIATIETVKCISCGFAEDCTAAYILGVRERYQGRWLCGLCIEAVKDETLQSEEMISVEEALERHISFCHKFRESCHEEEIEHPIFAMGRVLRRSIMDSPRALRSNSSGSLPETANLFTDETPPPPVRSGSCFASLSS